MGRKRGESMKPKKTPTEYKNQWQSEHCDRVNLTLPKGKKELVRAHAESRGESLNGFINRAIDETMERDAEKREE